MIDEWLNGTGSDVVPAKMRACQSRLVCCYAEFYMKFVPPEYGKLSRKIFRKIFRDNFPYSGGTNFM